MFDYLATARTEDLFRAIGICGFFMYVGVYAALSLRLVTGDCLTYFIGNTLAATLVLVGLSYEFNLASALIQVFWICIGLVAIALRLGHRASDRRANRAARQRAERLARGGAAETLAARSAA